MNSLITSHRNGFNWGMTSITQVNEQKYCTEIGFSILKLRRGDKHFFHSKMELALLHLYGSIRVEVDESIYENQRNSLFDEPPFAVHVPRDVPLVVEALKDAELAVFETENEHTFPSKVYLTSSTPNELRGKGLFNNTFCRYVRTIFDGSNSHSNAKLVLGEVVNFPGCWSSYPPHHHPHPEIYHYRFTDPRGYGHAELGEDVYKVKQYDTIKILDGKDHSQCSAPGYGMYYIWVIKHLENAPYKVPEFTEDHRWVMDTNSTCWQPMEEGVLR